MATVVSYPAVGTGNEIKKAVSPGKGAEDVNPRMKVTFLAPQLYEPAIIASCKVSIASRTSSSDTVQGSVLLPHYRTLEVRPGRIS